MRPAVLALVLAACGDDLRPAIDAGPDPDAPVARSGWLVGGAADDDVLDLLVIGDAVVVGGYRDGELGRSNLEPDGDAVGIVRAYRTDGTLLWEQRLDTPGADSVEALHAASDLVAAGRTSAAFPGAVSAGQRDAFVARLALDGSGAPAVRQLGDERPQHPVRIARDDAGGLLLAGYDDVLVQGGAVIDFENATTARVTAAFAVDFARRSRTPEADLHLALAAPGPPGELIVGGTVTARSGRGPYVHRLDADGALRWMQRLTANGLDAVTAIELGPDGKLYAAGVTLAALGPRSYGEQDIFVAVLDPATGAIERAMQAGSAGSDYPRDLAIAPDGTVYVAGETLGALPGRVLAGEADVAVVRFSPAGAWTGAWQIGTPGDETARAIAISPRDPSRIWIAGYTHAALLRDASPAGGRDGFVLTLGAADLDLP